MSVLVNGSPTKEFLPKRGLRLGDPLVLFLFLIVAEGLAGVSRMAVEKNLIDSLEIGREKVKVNMLHYVDDTLLFCETNVKSVFNIKATLYCFDLSSRLKVNFMKSKLGGLAVEQIMIQHFVEILNCGVMVTPFLYLGLSVGGCHKRRAFWDGMVGIMNKSLSRWKGRFLSLVGRICLKNLILSSIPLFYLSLFKMPETVTNELVKIQRNFL